EQFYPISAVSLKESLWVQSACRMILRSSPRGLPGCSRPGFPSVGTFSRVQEVVAKFGNGGRILFSPKNPSKNNDEQNPTIEKTPYVVITSPISSDGEENPSATYQTPYSLYPISSNEQNHNSPRHRYEVPTSPISSDEGENPSASTSQTQID
ncbi:hypothetical protein TNIN_50461, partial [Trichonephila inaurata madagascariensis]